MCVLNSAISQLFYFKSNAPRCEKCMLSHDRYLCGNVVTSFSSYFIILVTHPAGKWLAKVLPGRTIYWHKWSFSLNPGEWSIKEHLLGRCHVLNSLTPSYSLSFSPYSCYICRKSSLLPLHWIFVYFTPVFSNPEVQHMQQT